MMRNPLNLALTGSGIAGIPPLLYLACPYSHRDGMVRAHRALHASDMAARLMRQGYSVFSPISHGHAVCDADMTHEVGTDAASWAVLNDTVMIVCAALVVLDIPGVWESAGVRQEVAKAAEFKLPVNLIRSYGNTEEVEADVDPMLFADARGTL